MKLPPSDSPSFSPGRTATRLDPHLCRLVLLPEFDPDLLYVVRSLMEVTRLGCLEAAEATWEARQRGRASLLLATRERAELYVEQFAARGLMALIEPC